MNGRSVLGSLADCTLTGIAGCLGDAGFGAAESTPTPVVNREVPPGGDGGEAIPQFQGAPEHTGRLDATGPTESVTTFWRRTPYRYDHSQPVVVGERVYVSFAGNLIRLDRTTGERRWLTDVVLGGVRAAPTVTDGVVVVATQAGDVYALGEA